MYKLSGNRRKPFYAVYKGQSTGRTYSTADEAKAALEALVASTRPELFTSTLADVYETWSDVAYRDMGDSSRRGYTIAWSHIPTTLRNRVARSVRTDDIQAVVDDLQQQGMSDSTAGKVKFLYSQLCKWMMQRDLIDKNYAEFVKVQKTEHRKTETFDADEIGRINALATQGDPADRMTQAAMLTMMLLFTGMRISELFSLRTENVHLDGEVPYIQGGVKTAAGRNRVIPIYHRVLPFFDFFHRHAGGETLISGYAGRKTANGWRAYDYKVMLEHLGIPYKVPHNTRKTMATNAAQSGMDQLALLKLMGWTDMAIGNQYYIAPDVAYLAEEMDKLRKWDARLNLSETQPES